MKLLPGISPGWPIVAHQSDRQGENAPKGYIARQEMTPEIAHIQIGRLHNGMLWMQSDPNPHNLKYFFLVPILIRVERQSMQLLVSLHSRAKKQSLIFLE